MSKILFIQTSFLGDVILSTALIEKWQQHYPKDAIDVLIRKGNEGVFQDNPFVRELLIWDKSKNKYNNLFKILQQIRWNKYDIIFNLQRFASTGFLTAFSGAKETIGFDKNPFSILFSQRFTHSISAQSKLHETQRNQQLIEKYTDTFPANPKIYSSPENAIKIKSITSSNYIVIAPTSVWFTKQYPKEKWISFLSKLKHPAEIIFIGSKSDGLHCAKIIAEAGLKNQSLQMKNLCGELSIQESAELMKHAIMNFVNDSAPLHMASAVNAPVTAIFCSTVPAFGFGPLSENQQIVQTYQVLACRPCGLHGYKSCPKKHFDCAFGIEDEQLLQQIN